MEARNKIQQHVWQRGGKGPHKSAKDYHRQPKHRNRRGW